MRMTPFVRKFALTSHVATSVGWLGAAVAYLALAGIGLRTVNPALSRAIYLVLEPIALYAIVPLCLAALVTGLVQSIGTEWGLVRHYWILAKLVLSVAASIVLLVHLRAIGQVADIAASANPAFGSLRVQLLVHAAGGVVILLTTTMLSVFKPLGRTRWYPRANQVVAAGPASTPIRPLLVVGALLLLALLVHLAGFALNH
jgi:hypothetical protein